MNQKNTSNFINNKEAYHQKIIYGVVFSLFLLLQNTLSAQSPNFISQEIKLNDILLYSQDNPAVVTNPDGSFVAVWEHDRGNLGRHIYARFFNADGSPQNSSFQVSNTTLRNYRSQIATDGNGKFIVVWYGQDDVIAPANIYGRIFDDSGVFLNEDFRINQYTDYYQINPKVAMNKSGEFVVVWETGIIDGVGHPQDEKGIFGQKFNSDGSKMGNEFRVNTYTNGPQAISNISMNDQNEFIVCWTSFGQNNGFSGIYAQKYDSQWNVSGQEILVSDSEPFYSNSNGDINLNNDGSYNVVWAECRKRCDAVQLYGQKYDGTGKKIGAKFRIDNSEESISTPPSLTYDTKGNSLVVWSDNRNNNIYGRYFDADGIPQGSEIIMNDPRNGSRGSSAVSISPNGNIVVVWSSVLEGDNNGSDIHARILEHADSKIPDVTTLSTDLCDSPSFVSFEAVEGAIGYLFIIEISKKNGQIDILNKRTAESSFTLPNLSARLKDKSIAIRMAAIFPDVSIGEILGGFSPRQKLILDCEDSNQSISDDLEQRTTAITQHEVYPNPVHDVLQIQLSDENTSELSLRVIDLTGKIVLEVDDLPNTNQASINVESLQKGQYILQLNTTQGIEQLSFVKL